MEEFAGLVLLLLATALVINLIKGGPAQVHAWIRAKALGQPVGA